MEEEGRKGKHEIGKIKGNIQEENGMEKPGKEILCTPRERGRRTGEELRARERSNSASILDYVRREEGIENELVKIKKKREEKEKETQEIFKEQHVGENTARGVDGGKRRRRESGEEERGRNADSNPERDKRGDGRYEKRGKRNKGKVE
ncbi:unnamed protein product [Lasius platythorax]|uniref:Uncharacterized protein n=1 Tax=Lasius platythorax TaxID=488582 RepID=A0AAV2MWZ8_9HYME